MNSIKNVIPSKLAEYMAYACSYLRRGDLDKAVQMADDLEKRSENWGLTGKRIKLLTMKACAYQLKDETETALPFLAEAVSLGAIEGYIRTFVSFGKPIMELIAELSQQESSINSIYIQKIIAAFLNAPSGGILSSPIHPDYISFSSAQQGVLIEPLTPRELEILHLVATEQNNQEIAKHLNISINTVKTHISNIFTKLGVSNRLQAANRSRQLNLI